MLQGGETVLAAVSGGADSVALLDVLHSLAADWAWVLHAVHVHHGLRPEADADAGFVQALCTRLDVPLHVERVVVRREPPWDGLEAEARRARYRAFRDVAQRIGAHRVATAHTADDQAETVLMRLFEGAGPRGLAGIARTRGLYIRPLLDARRAEIEAHLRGRGIPWVEDASNLDTRMLRNRVRHEILPFLSRVVEPSLVDRLCRSAALVRSMIDDLEAGAARELRRLGRKETGGWILTMPELASLPRELAVETVRQAARELGHPGSLRGHGQRGLRRLLASGSGRGALRSGGLTMERSGRLLRVGPERLPPLLPHDFPMPGELLLPEVGLVLEARSFPRDDRYVVPREASRVAFDADALPPRLQVRARRRGDRFVPFGGPAERRLKSFLIEAGVPRWERERVPLLEAAGDIIWVAGLRRGQAAPIRPETRRILEVTLRSGSSEGSPLAGVGRER